MTLHFAYGSNMSRALMGPRCRSAMEVGPAVLAGYRFFISADGYASVRPSPGEIVHGIVWRLTARDRAALDAYESVDTGLYQARMLPVACGARRLDALVYIGRAQATGRPKPGYLELVLAAAREVALPDAYVRTLARFADRRAAGADAWLPVRGRSRHG